MSSYTPTIGLEVHAELKTRTKMFCNSKNDVHESVPNTNVCPVCMGHPGTLPTVNKEAVRQVLRFGVAVGGEIADFTEFDRKNYFYPDIPKGYQISQYKYPLVKGGSIKGFKLTRVHLEEDTARSQHTEEGSLVDFNRAGVPLMELVTEPVLHSSSDAALFARELQLILRKLGASDANMERGEMRIEANISISKDENLGTKVEVKNLNSFKSVERAIEYEIERHKKLLEEGNEIAQETRGWDDEKGETFSQRAKENAHDYRYFPDPDIPKLKVSEIEEFKREELQKSLPELPEAYRKRLVADFGLRVEDAELYANDDLYGPYFEAVAGELKDQDAIQKASNYILSDVRGYYTDKTLPHEFPVRPERFARLIKMAQNGDISSRGTKDLLTLMLEGEEGDPETLAEEHNLIQKSDSDFIETLVKEIIAENPEVVEEYKSGKENALMYLVGQGMKKSKGAANPELLQKVFVDSLSS